MNHLLTLHITEFQLKQRNTGQYNIILSVLALHSLYSIFIVGAGSRSGSVDRDCLSIINAERLNV